MFDLFLNPFSMLAGGALVLSPIIIHLINRLRYRRVKWAAMEFLLKSQKRNRRKLILKQLILLLLRILIVLLVALLVARYLGAVLGLGQPRGTVHVVLLDDTASMTDAWRDDGVARHTFDRAKAAIVDDIARGAAQASTPQALELLRLTNPDEPFRIDRLNAQTVEDLANHLAGVNATAMHADVAPAVEAAKRSFDRYPATKRVLHVVGDFRSKDWSGPGSEALAKLIPDAVGGGHGAVHLLDAAHPIRGDGRGAVVDHGNVGILDLQPDTRMTAKFLPVEFTITVANFTGSLRENIRIAVKVNGQMREDASTSIPKLPPGLTQHYFTATFDRLGPNTVTATIPADEAGLAIDDKRYAVVDVRERVPLLFVTGDAASRGKPEDDGYYLRALFLESARGFEVVERGPQELEKPLIDRYPAVYLLNVPRLSDKARANLEGFVRAGGGLFVAMGEQVDVEFYNRLYADGKGILPAPVSRATEPLTEAQKFERRLDPAWPPRLFVRSPNHPIISRIYRDDPTREANTYLKFLFVERYLPVPRVRWSPQPGVTEELFSLPNYRSVEDYKESAQKWIDAVQKLADKLPAGDPANKLLRERLDSHLRAIKTVLFNNRPLYSLADAIEKMLSDAGDPARPELPKLTDFWARPDSQPLKADLHRFMDSVRYGDPLVVAGRYGRGHVVQYLTTAGTAWNDWPNGPARPYFVMLMLEVQKYLAGVAPDANRPVGRSIEIVLDPEKFEPRLRRTFERELPNDPSAAPVDRGEQIGSVASGKLSFTFAEGREPGVYRFELTPRGAGTPDAPKAEPLAYAFNVDTAAEGDLRRATRDELAAAVPGMQLHTPGGDLATIMKDRQSDWSESPWFFLVLLGVLVAEQAMAVHLSYHLSGDAGASVGQATRGGS